MVTVAKFGGKVSANGSRVSNIAEIIRDEQFSAVVISAQGKRHDTDTKITRYIRKGVTDFHGSDSGYRSEVFEIFFQRSTQAAKDLGLNPHILDDVFHQFEILGRKRWESLDMTLDQMEPQGEVVNAVLLDNKLQSLGVNSRLVLPEDIGMYAQGKFREGHAIEGFGPKWGNTLKEMNKDGITPVIPGYYFVLPDGERITLGNGGSDQSGALIARYLGANEYHNFTDVDGIFKADPNVVRRRKPEVISRLSYDVQEESSLGGASVLQPESINPVREAGISVRVRNAFHPERAGTLIVPEVPKNGKKAEIIAHDKGPYAMIEIDQSGIHNQVGYLNAVTGKFLDENFSIDYVATSRKNIYLVVQSKGNRAKINNVRSSLNESGIVPQKSLRVSYGHSLITVVGQDMGTDTEEQRRLSFYIGRAGVKKSIPFNGDHSITYPVPKDKIESLVRNLHARYFPKK
ncbi:aspartate kinase [Candidatus Woesearchaeota archaeon]|nr:aspartate kinase [Candidatus Woesearchaeota archaeon]